MTNAQAALLAAATFCADRMPTLDGQARYTTSEVLEMAGAMATELDAWDAAARQAEDDEATP